MTCMRCSKRQHYVGARTPRGHTVWLCQMCAGEVIEQTWAHLDNLSTHQAAEALVGVRSGVLLHGAMEAAGLPGVDGLEVKGGLPGAR